MCLIAGKTGPLEAYAKQTENGFMLGLEYLTKGTMKVGDDKLEVLVKDDQLKPDRGKSLLEECYSDDKADIAVGTTGSPIALAMLPVAEEKKKILIVEPAVANSITGDKWNRYIFRTGRSSYQDALADAAAMPASGDVSVGMLGLDTAFGRDGVAAFKQALAGIRPNVKVVAEEYAAGNTADFAPFAERLFNALKDKPGKKIIGFIWAGAASDGQVRRHEARPLRHRAGAGRQHPARHERVEAVRRHRGRHLLLLRLPQERDERLAEGRVPEALQRAAGLLRRGRLRGGRRRSWPACRRPAPPTPRS